MEDVNEVQVSTEQSTETEVETVVETEVEVPEKKPGEKTDSAKLLESLQKEREKRRLAEEELASLKSKPAETEVFSDEGKVLHSEIVSLRTRLEQKEKNEELSALQTKFAPLKDKETEFEQFCLDNPGMRMETAAKAFLFENDLMETPQPRKGLERNSGGGRTPVASDKMTADEVDSLRTNNYREYSKRVRAGTIKL